MDSHNGDPENPEPLPVNFRSSSDVDEDSSSRPTGLEIGAEVAYSVGFKSLSHFAKAFREQFGVAPSEYG